jgi:hypothetical protein
MRFAFLWAPLVLLVACGGDTGAPDAAGLPDGCVDCGRDAGPPRADAGGPSCGDALPRPEPFDCERSAPPATGEPITAEPRTWTWVPFDDAFCMDGSPTGVGVSLAPESDRVMIFLQGGGACFDSISCIGVANPDGFDGARLEAIGGFLSRGLFDRDDPDNPVADWNHVFVPYCTGDVHAGNREDGFEGRRHVGYANVTAYLRRLVPTFADASRVLLAGQSAGGLGALVNYAQTQEAFGCTPVYALDDAGSILPEPYLRACLQQLLRDTWGLTDAVPAGCAECTCEDGGGLYKLAPYLAARYPDGRFGLVTSMEDNTMRGFYGYGYSRTCDFPASMPRDDYAAGLLELRDALAPTPGFSTFYVPGEQHTFTYRPLGDTSVGGTTLAEWIRQLVEDEPAWGDVGP